MKLYPLLFSVSIISGLWGQAPPPPAPPPAPGPLATASVDPNHVVASFGDEKITKADFDALIAALPEQYQAHVRGPGRRQFIENVIMVKVLARQAVIMHLDQSQGTREQLDFQTKNLLANMAYKAMTEKANVDNAVIQKYYEEHKNEYSQLRAHHILIRFKGSHIPAPPGQKELTEEEALAKAQELVKRLRAGGDFEATAKAESADTGSGAKGGDMGLFSHGQMVKPFEDAAFSLKPGEISDPVRSEFGYHIIRVDKIETKTLGEVRGEIEGKIRPDLAKKQLEDLKSKVSVTMDDKYFGPPPAPAGSPVSPGPK